MLPNIPNPTKSENQSKNLNLSPPASPPNTLPSHNPNIPHPHNHTFPIAGPLLILQPHPIIIRHSNTHLPNKTPNKNNLSHIRPLHHLRPARIIIQPA